MQMITHFWKVILVNFFLLLMLSCSDPTTEKAAFLESVNQFLTEYTDTYQQLAYASSEAHWASNTQIIEGDSTNDVATRKADEAFAKFTGSADNIQQTRTFLEKSEWLTDLQKRQLDAILYEAANNPATVEQIVKERIKAETAQTKTLYGYEFILDGKPITPNQIDEQLKNEMDVKKRQAVWESSKAVGMELKPGLVNLRRLRNETVQALGYDDYFAYQVSDYGMTTDEMMDLNRQLIGEIWPLYRELHTYTRYKLAERFKEPVPEYIPAHWLSNRWGQDWNELITVEGFDLDGALSEKSAEWVVEQGEEFYISLGLDELPQVFWDKSSLYPLPEGATYKKNTHASAWHLDLKNDVRSLMSVEPNASWYETVHHELGHIYYYMLYSTPEVPILLRGGANRAFHEAFGSMLGLAAMQQPFLEGRGLIEKGTQTDEMSILLKEALNYIVFIPFSSGVMTEFEHELYSNNLSEDEFNKKWWELKAKYQGIVPPDLRGEEYCDASSKTHINNDAAQYYDYALSYVNLFQFHNHIAKNILNEDPRKTNYFGNKEVGDFLAKVMAPGKTRDWRELMQEELGQEMSATPMLEYFDPLMKYLQNINEGRIHVLPETPYN